jgi:site-specific DNA recombinase
VGGRIISSYGGQEHGTPGWERKQVDLLISHSTKGLFDAVIVAYADRWSRDNQKSKQGLQTFREHGIKFFVGTMQMDLFDPQACFILGMNAEVGEFVALQGAKKSLENRIERARRGIPTCGSLPFGRIFDEETGGWRIDPKKQALVEDVARRYLAGVPMQDLADLYRLNLAHLHKIMMQRCGPEWVQEFHSKRLNIHETITIEVPSLLPEETIQAVRERAHRNQSYKHGQRTRPYLLSGLVYCSHCGYRMTAQANSQQTRFYRHAVWKGRKTRLREKCSKGGWVNADNLETAVIRDLFETFGNVQKAEEAMLAAIPDRQRMELLRGQLEQATAKLGKANAARQRILRLVAKDTVTEEEAERQLRQIKENEAQLRQVLRQTAAELETIPSREQIQEVAKRTEVLYADASFASALRHGNPDELTWEEKKRLIEMVFGGNSVAGQKLGVYIEEIPGQEHTKPRRWRYTLRGHLINDVGVTPRSGEWDPESGAGYLGRELLESQCEDLVADSSSYQPRTSLLRGRTPNVSPPFA